MANSAASRLFDSTSDVQPGDSAADSGVASKLSADEIFDRVILDLGRKQIRSREDVQALVHEITERAAEALDVKHASLWVFTDGHSELQCKSTFDRVTHEHSKGVVLERACLGGYYDSLRTERVIAIENVEASVLTSGFYDFRLRPMGVTALLDAPLWADGQLFGVVSFLDCAQSRRQATPVPRVWSRSEQVFASSVADVIALALHASDRRRYERELSFRLEFERLLLTLTNQLINVDSSQIESGLKQALAQIGEFSGVDRTYLFFFAEDKSLQYTRHEWCAEGVTSYGRSNQPIVVDAESQFIRKLLEGSVVHVPQVALLPEGLYSEREEWLREGIKSLVAVPLISGGQTLGFFGFDSVKREQTWSGDFISLLKIAGGMLLRVEERRRSEQKERRLTAQVQHSQKLESLGILAGGIAHDFNNLLMGVLGNAELLIRSLSPGDWPVEYAKRVQLAAKRAADLTHQLLAYSGKGKFDVATVDLSEIVEEMKPLLRTAVSRKAELSFALTLTAVPVRVDITQIRQIILNLVTNASEAIGESCGKISLSTGSISVDRNYLKHTYVDDNLPEGDYVYLDIKDNGSGMRRETVERIFDPFFTTKFTGRGLGLAVVMGIVRSHRGAIKVFSEPGEGTTFRVLLKRQLSERMRPVSSADLEGDADRMTDSQGGSGLVLVVDDEDITLLATQDMLEASGFEVVAAHSGKQAIAVFAEHAARLEAVVLDMTMPQMSGTEVFLQLQKIDPSVPIIFSSGYSELDALEKVRGLPIAGFIQKPYGVAALCEIVNRARSAAVRNG